MYASVHSTVCFLIIITGHSCSPFVRWGDGTPGSGRPTNKLEPVTYTHTYKQPGCVDVLLMYGYWTPYCGEFTRGVVDTSHVGPIEDVEEY